MKLLYAFDEWLLDKFQRFSDAVSKKTGIGNLNYKIADSCISIYVILSLVNLIIFDFHFGRLFLIIIILYNGIILRGILIRESTKENEAQSQDGIARKRKDNLVTTVRILMLFVVLIVSIVNLLGEYSFFEKLLSVLAWQGLIFFYYFLACSGLPRQKGKIRQWVRSLFGRRELVPVRNK